MRRITILAALLVIVATAAQAQVTGSVSIGGQSADTSGGESRFRELTGGERSGVFIEYLNLDTPNLEVTSSFSTGNQGFAKVTYDNDLWRGGVRINRTRTWSGLSFADDVLPGGAGVASLYPGTTELDPLFGEDEPYSDRTRLEAFLTRRFGASTSLTLRGGVRSRDGVRVPNIGAFSFGDLGTAAFFAPGLEEIDSRSQWGAVEARTSAGRLAIRTELGAISRENTTDYALPAYSANALLDLNRWNERTDADSQWLRADAVYTLDLVTIEGGVARVQTSAALRGSDIRGTREGFRLDDGDADGTITSGGLGATFRLGARATLAVAADLQARENDGGGNVLLRTAVNQARTELSSDRVGGTADFRARVGENRFRVRGRMSATRTDVREDLSAYAQDLTRNVDRADLRAEVSRRLTRSVRGRAWSRVGSEKVEIDLRSLDSGFTTGDADRSDVGGGFELSFGRSARTATLSVAMSRSDFENDAPYFDPVFDPTQSLVVTEGTLETLRASGSSVWTFGAHSVWGELGWLSYDYGFDQAYTHAGFTWLDEKVEGLVGAAGAEVHPTEAMRLIGSFELVRDQEDLDRTLTRGSLEIAQTIRNVEIFGRWTGGDFDAPRARFDEFSADVFALGVRTTF